MMEIRRQNKPLTFSPTGSESCWWKSSLQDGCSSSISVVCTGNLRGVSPNSFSSFVSWGSRHWLNCAPSPIHQDSTGSFFCNGQGMLSCCFVGNFRLDVVSLSICVVVHSIVPWSRSVFFHREGTTDERERSGIEKTSGCEQCQCYHRLVGTNIGGLLVIQRCCV